MRAFANVVGQWRRRRCAARRALPDVRHELLDVPSIGLAINSFYDDAHYCSRKLGRVFDHVVKVVAGDLVCCGTGLTDSLPAHIWQKGATHLSIGASMILHLKNLFPTAPIVAAGFSFHREDQWNATWHHFEEEHDLITNLSGVYVLPSAADIDAFAFDSV